MTTKKKFLFISILFDLILFALIGSYLLSPDETYTLDSVIRAGLSGQFVQLEDGVVHYELSGPANGELVVLVHGFSVPYYVWDPTVSALTAEGYQVLRYDLYGRGYSDRPNEEYDLNLFVRQLSQLTEVVTLNKPFHLVGLSMGAPISAAFANQYAAHVLSLTLIAPEVLPVSKGSIFPMSVPLLGEWVMKVYMVPVYLPGSQKSDFYNPAIAPDWEARYRDQLKFKGFRQAILSTIRNLPKMNALKEYEQIGRSGLPVLVVWGEDDQSVSYDAILQAMQAMPQAEYLQVPQAGHLVHYEKANDVNRKLLEFIGK
ncbi:MAG: alpha/beta hydrolase [Chloroflexi bacterium HGW-Chloroflexi-8]|nr:MAG: alpha/beta hydrolase [Chloroflexi bacterium HGW-Chloroflexi-8]